MRFAYPGYKGGVNASSGSFGQTIGMDATAPMTPTQRLRSIFSGSVGNLVEWYDWYAHSAFAIYFAPHFFPKGDTTAQLLDTAAIKPAGRLFGLLLPGRRQRRARDDIICDAGRTIWGSVADKV